MIALCKILLFSDALFFESLYRSMFARAVSFNREIVGSIRLKSFITTKRAVEKLFQLQGYKNIKDSEYHENCV